ncbi:MAG: mechanosensitive ion channel protein MscS [unclassified Hahellaceae]|nr:mechanosensitive ion channel protein MscS [Hahellaceae bacterium]|tara:strand:+ start:7060 stop:7884 length:825 start_codon:yes stop_codon:yes gene_type:complete
MDNIQPHLDHAIELAIAYIPQLLLALLTLIIGLWIINHILGLFRARLAKRFDPTLSQFVLSLGSVVLKALLLVSVASMIGIATTSFIAVLGAVGLAIGLALQGNLSNFASGVIILIFKPFRVGDVIEGAGHSGVVKEIQIFTTVMTTFDNRRVIIPNSSLVTDPIVNINVEPTRRVDFKFGISYDDDITLTKQQLNALIDKDERILKDPAPLVVLSELGDSSVNFTVRVWVNTPDYWGVYFAMMENVKRTFDAMDISIPYPQRDVHIYQKQPAA